MTSPHLLGHTLMQGCARWSRWTDSLPGNTRAQMVAWWFYLSGSVQVRTVACLTWLQGKRPCHWSCSCLRMPAGGHIQGSPSALRFLRWHDPRSAHSWRACIWAACRPALQTLQALRHVRLCTVPHGNVWWTAVSEVELSRAPDASATAVRVDATGTHALVSLKSGNTLGSTAEHLYVHSKWKKAKPITKLRGVNITAAAWNADLVSEGSSG